ncbi:hypothetical protein O3M35_001308 [Rhynocoris fuscipes]|uniref:Pescadillo homolog n=1 Tax=Rhynocoris fuscipes TaxID=488301 RepID=A0AAW1DSI3_9HEMI
MGGIRKKKFSSGEGSQYWTRATALKKLQLSLKDFRRLCILKGIYPREPRNRKKAQKGSTGIKILYNKKDIQFLMHEPIIWKFRESKVLGRKIGRAKAMHEYGLAKKLMNTPLHLKLDHIIKERYPTFIDALRDLDDCLTLCTLFSTFPTLRHIPRDQMSLCRRLTLEFMHAVIEAKALRKVFISIKGYYFQAEFKGQLITWIMPHPFGFAPQSKEEVDFRIMSTFVQLYIVLLGFVNFRLYHLLNLNYPPKVCNLNADNSDKELVDKQVLESERIAALNLPLRYKSNVETAQTEDVQVDTFNMENEENYAELNKINRLKRLFEGTKVFLNREVPREPLVFILRCFGAKVSWDKTLFVGATFDESDESITHQIIDRPSLDKQYISRYYVQPQWVFDSVNARELLPVEKYFIGCVLPPHLSPFVEDEASQLYNPKTFQAPTNEVSQNEDDKKNEDSSDSSEEEDNDEKDSSEEDENGDDEDKMEAINDEDVAERRRKELKKKMVVSTGKIIAEDPEEMKKQKLQEFKLRERMVEKKYRALYRSMRKGQALRRRDATVLKKKRELLADKKLKMVPNQNWEESSII